jgi:outer membrane receptor protein involved in Fe transport
VYVFARNLLDEEYLTHAYLFQGEPAATLGVPRMVGMEMRARF